MSITTHDCDYTKKTISDLAILGGPPAFGSAIHVGRPNIGNREKFLERVNDILDRRWLTNGGYYVTEFEKRIAKMIGVEHCVAVTNATVGLEIAVRALGLEGEVIVPSFTFVATAHILQWLGLTPVFCDIDQQTHTLDPVEVEKLINPRTTGILGVHVWGRPCDIYTLNDIANRRGLKLFFDAAHAFGSSYQGRMIGTFGAAEVFSFHATKFLNSMEGGAIVTNDAQLAEQMRWMRNFGFTTYDKTDSIGINGKMSEVSAAMGLTNLESINEFVAINRANYKQYKEALADIEGIDLLLYDERERANYQYVVIELDQNKASLSRDHLMQVLHAENVLARRYFYPGCHRMEPYKSSSSAERWVLPHTEQVAGQVLTLPTGQAMTPESINLVCTIIRTALEHGSELRTSLGERSLA